jgi:hypothetical protein
MAAVGIMLSFSQAKSLKCLPLEKKEKKYKGSIDVKCAGGRWWGVRSGKDNEKEIVSS